MLSGRSRISGLRGYEISAGRGRRGVYTRYVYKKRARRCANCQPGEEVAVEAGVYTEPEKIESCKLLRLKRVAAKVGVACRLLSCRVKAGFMFTRSLSVLGGGRGVLMAACVVLGREVIGGEEEEDGE